MYSPQPPQQQPPNQQDPFQPQPYQQPYGQAPYGQQPYGQPPYGQPAKEPTTGLLLELIGLLGFMGIGWIWAGETVIGVALLIGWWVVAPMIIVVATLLSFVLIGLCLFPLLPAIPIASGIILMNRLKAKQAATANWPAAY
jgi:hypothetical protein